MTHARRSSSVTLGLALGLVVLALTGCKEEPPPPKPTVQPPKAAPVKPPEPRAAKECAAPLDLGPEVPLKVGERSAVSTGYRLEFKEPDADGQQVFGVLGPLNEDSGPNLLTIKKYLQFFAAEKVDAILVTGDTGEVAEGIQRTLKAVADAKVPVLAIIGNRECRADFTDATAAAQKDTSFVLNMNQFREVVFPGATVVSLPGYHDPNYINCATGCQYFKSTVDEVIRMAKEAKNPVVLLAHGPPHGEGSQALDYASTGGNVGDPEVSRALREGGIHFGAFSNIKEAGARATDLAGTTLVKPDVPSKELYVNPGPADTMGWEMNDNTKSTGMAAVLRIKGDTATWRHYRAKPLSAAEKQQARALDPPARSEGEEPAEAPKAPPGAPKGH